MDYGVDTVYSGFHASFPMTPSTPPAPLPGRFDRFLILGAVCLAGFVLPLNFTGPPIATPAIAAELGGSPAALTWMTNAFMLAFGSCLMAAGSLADGIGRKRMFGIGLVAFGVASSLLAFVPNLFWLNVLRIVQGIAAAAALSGGNAALAQEFHGVARLRAFSLLGTTFGVGLAFGPSLAGWLTEAHGWRSIFLSSVAVALAATVFGLPHMRESRDPAASGIDVSGSLAFTAMLAAFTAGVLEAPARGWSDPLVLAALIGSGLLLALFVRIERRSRRPMLDLALFRYPRFVGAQLLPIGTGFCYLVLIVLLPARLIGVEGYGALQAGLLMIALSLPMLVVPFVGAVASHRIPPGVLCSGGLLLAAAGLVWLGRAVPGPAWIAPLLLIGVGAAVPWGLMDGLAISVVPKERAGMAAGIFGASRVSGEGVTIALASAALATFLATGLQAALPGAAGHVAEAAQRLGIGDLAQARVLLAPALDPATLLGVYERAFAHLIDALAAATALTALIVLSLFGGASAHDIANTHDASAVRAGGRAQRIADCGTPG